MTEERYAQFAAERGFLRANFRLLTTDEGGRAHPLIGEYRANWSIGMPDPQNVGGAPMATDAGERVEPGETVGVRLFPIWPGFWANVDVGNELFAFEGTKLVGKAVVTGIVAPTMSEPG
jgi:translation elongation factor EF-Tu-like GTPase